MPAHSSSNSLSRAVLRCRMFHRACCARQPLWMLTAAASSLSSSPIRSCSSSSYARRPSKPRTCLCILCVAASSVTDTSSRSRCSARVAPPRCRACVGIQLLTLRRPLCDSTKVESIILTRLQSNYTSSFLGKMSNEFYARLCAPLDFGVIMTILVNALSSNFAGETG